MSSKQMSQGTVTVPSVTKVSSNSEDLRSIVNSTDNLPWRISGASMASKYSSSSTNLNSVIPSVRLFKSIFNCSKLYIISLWVAKLLIISDIVKLIHYFFYFLNDILMKTTPKASFLQRKAQFLDYIRFDISLGLSLLTISK